MRMALFWVGLWVVLADIASMIRELRDELCVHTRERRLAIYSELFRVW